MAQVSLIVLLKGFILDFLEHLLSGKRTVCLGVASCLKSFLVVCRVMLLGLELIWPKCSYGTNLEFSLCIFGLDAEMLFQ